MKTWRIRFEMICHEDGRKVCQQGKSTMAFALLEKEEMPDYQEALDYVEGHLYYCSSRAENHFLDTGKHEVHILEIQGEQ